MCSVLIVFCNILLFLGVTIARDKVQSKNADTLQPLYNTVLDITRFKDGSQKCIDYIEK